MASITLSQGSPITVHPVGALAFSGTVQLATETMIIVSESPSIISILRQSPHSGSWQMGKRRVTFTTPDFHTRLLRLLAMEVR